MAHEQIHACRMMQEHLLHDWLTAAIALVAMLPGMLCIIWHLGLLGAERCGVC